MLCLEDELDILEDPSFSVIVHSILTAIPQTCKRASFGAYGRQILQNLPTPCYTISSPLRPTHHSTLKNQNRMELVTKFRMLSVFSHMGPLWGTLSHFLKTSEIEVISLDCDAVEDLQRILQSIVGKKTV